MQKEIRSTRHCYRIREWLGEGGTSRVYRVTDVEDASTYAIKISFTDKASRDALRREARILDELSYPAFPSVREVWESQEGVYLVMTYIPGKTLAVQMEEQMCTCSAAFEPAVILPWLTQLVEALSELHRNHKVYCDLKPSNILIDTQGKVFLIDFGSVVEAGDHGAVLRVGTPGFASPEQFSHSVALGDRTDLYSFGALIYFLLTGRHPAEKMFRFQTVDAYRQWNTLIERCTQMQPEKRCTWREVRLVLHRLDHQGRKRRWIQLWQWGWKMLMIFMIVYWSVRGLYVQLDRRTYAHDLTYSETVEPEQALEMIMRAIAMMPENGEGYGALLDLYLRDGCLSVDEWQQMQQTLDSYGVEAECRDAAWTILHYKIGMAIVMQSDGMISECQAAGWFQRAAQADVEQMDFGRYNDRKRIWKKRAAVWMVWCQDSGSQWMSDQDRQDRDFWKEVEILQEDPFCAEEADWELGMDDQILGRLMDAMSTGLNSAVVTEAKIGEIVDRIDSDMEKVEENRHLQDEKRRILEKEKVLRRRLSMTEQEMEHTSGG